MKKIIATSITIILYTSCALNAVDHPANNPSHLSNEESQPMDETDNPTARLYENAQTNSSLFLTTAILGICGGLVECAIMDKCPGSSWIGEGLCITASLAGALYNFYQAEKWKNRNEEEGNRINTDSEYSVSEWP